MLKDLIYLKSPKKSVVGTFPKKSQSSNKIEFYRFLSCIPNKSCISLKIATFNEHPNANKAIKLCRFLHFLNKNEIIRN